MAVKRSHQNARLAERRETARLQAAYERYGWRAVAILIYKIFFMWPRLRSRLITLKLRLLLGAKVGKGITFGKNFSISIPGGCLEIGERAYFNDRCVMVIATNPPAILRIGINCYVANDVLFCASQEIIIGNNVLIGEYSSLRDSSHNYKDAGRNINEQGDTLGKIIIEDDVWIGRGTILIGSPETLIIGRGAVIGANSVVKNSIPDYAIAVGSPAKVVKYRKESETLPPEILSVGRSI
ncbi:MAG TPA: acyltransferase [Pyrinomonadaceae bacterium]|nr:acyltransferase [Pyrinomonadaceae bacterium]